MMARERIDHLGTSGRFPIISEQHFTARRVFIIKILLLLFLSLGISLLWRVVLPSPSDAAGFLLLFRRLFLTST